MNTEITDIKKFNGWVLYDAECRLCTAMAGRVRGLLAARCLELVPLQTPWVRERLVGLDLLAEMRLLKPDGTLFGGADAFLEICRYYRLGWPVYQLGRIPMVTRWLHAGYRWIARNRNCVNGACAMKATGYRMWWCFSRCEKPVAERSVRRRKSAFTFPGCLQHTALIDFLPLIAPPCLAVGFTMQLAPWVFMWVMAFALYADCKWLTYREARRRGIQASAFRTLGYLLAWPGMDAMTFLDTGKVPAKPRIKEWLLALGKIILGAVLLGLGARWAYPVDPILSGWVGMTGIILLLHFGWFYMGSLLWRRAGVAATPLMRNPLRAKSVAEFWGERWNTAFNELVFRFTYRPLRRRTTAAIAMMLVFGLSGLIHELVISVPARAGYGLPTLYFLIQGLGIIAERSDAGQTLGLGHGGRGWLFTVLIVAGPAYWLFHPPFIHNVILPMLTAIGAT